MPMKPAENLDGALEDVFRDHWGRVLASLVGFLGDIELAEDAAQEAFARPPNGGRRTVSH